MCLHIQNKSWTLASLLHLPRTPACTHKVTPTHQVEDTTKNPSSKDIIGREAEFESNPPVEDKSNPPVEDKSNPPASRGQVQPSSKGQV